MGESQGGVVSDVVGLIRVMGRDVVGLVRVMRRGVVGLVRVMGEVRLIKVKGERCGWAGQGDGE